MANMASSNGLIGNLTAALMHRITTSGLTAQHQTAQKDALASEGQYLHMQQQHAMATQSLGATQALHAASSARAQAAAQALQQHLSAAPVK